MRSKASRYWITCSTIIAFLAILIFVFDFYRLVQKNDLAIQHEELESFSSMKSSFTNEHLLRSVGALETLGAMIEAPISTNTNGEEFELLRSTLSGNTEFSYLGILTLGGKLVTTDGEETVILDVSRRSYVSELAEAEGAVITSLKRSMLTQDGAIVILVPVLDQRGDLAGAVHGVLSTEAFFAYEDAQLNSSSRTHYIIDKQGGYVLRSDIEGKSCTHENLYDCAVLADGTSARQTILDRMQTDTTFSLDLLIDNTLCTACFTPLTCGEWYTVVIFPYSDLNTHLTQLLDKEVYLLLVKVLVVFAFVGGVIIYRMRTEAAFERTRETQLRNRLLSDVQAVVEVDLTADKVLHCSESVALPDDIGSTWDEFLLRHMDAQVDEEYHEYLFNAICRQSLQAYYMSESAHMVLECQTTGETGGLWQEFTIDLEQKENGSLCVFLAVTDIDARKRREMVLKELAERDSLTRLYHRGVAADMVNSILRRTHAPETSHAFIILDLDRFKPLNDTLGHSTGDRALQDVATLLLEHFRKEDIVCRLGGDEFIVFAPDIPLSAAERKAEELLDALHMTYGDDEWSITISACVGLALAPEHGATFQELYQCADKALYRAKAAGPSTLCIYRD